MKDIGTKVKCKVKANLCMQIRMCIKVNLLVTRQMAMEPILKKVARSTKDIGLMINHTETESKR